MPVHDRYRIENDRFCIDVRVRSAQQLFDMRDPAPFRERDLDDEAVAYLTDAVQDLPARAPVKVVVWIAGGPAPAAVPDATIADAMRSHFTYECDRVGRDIRTEATRRRLFLVAGSALLATFLSLAELTRLLPPGAGREVLREGCVITGWVAMWRPLEALFYDRWPLTRRRRLLERLQKATVEVRRVGNAEHPGA